MVEIYNPERIPVTQINYQSYLTETEIAAIESECTHYELRSAASIEALKIVQQERRWISDDSLLAIAEILHMSAAELEGIATFYNHIYRRPVGRYVIHLCNSISCWLNDYTNIQTALEQELNISMGETTPDNEFTLLSNACLGACDKAPAMMINGQYYEQISVDQISNIIRQLRLEEEQ